MAFKERSESEEERERERHSNIHTLIYIVVAKQNRIYTSVILLA